MVPLISGGPSAACRCLKYALVISLCAEIKCGVPQGSILGALSFLIYMNDMSNVVTKKLLLYADDSVILVVDKHKSPAKVLI